MGIKTENLIIVTLKKIEIAKVSMGFYEPQYIT